MDDSIRWKEHLKPIQGLRSFLHQLCSISIPLGVVTSDDSEQAREHLETLGIVGYFESIIDHDTVHKGKPFPDIARKACQQLRIQPQKTLRIGDSNGDMIMGKNAHLLAHAET